LKNVYPTPLGGLVMNTQQVLFEGYKVQT